MSKLDAILSQKEVRIYLAGKIEKYGWREPFCQRCGFNLSREFCNSDGVEAILSSGFPEKELRYEGASLIYTGPYFVGDDHGCAHGRNTHGTFASDGAGPSGHGDVCIGDNLHHDWASSEERQAAVFRHCLTAVLNSDIVFAWLQPEAYGTVAELAYAYAAQKYIIVGGPGSSRDSDMWFPSLMCNAISDHETPTDALARLFERRVAALSVASKCESPIEHLMLSALREAGIAEFVFPQYPIGPYRVDFALIKGSLFIAVECDGHDFHERTKEQAARDKQRDRFLQKEGWKVLRFTGSEIHKDAAKCAAEVAAILGA